MNLHKYAGAWLTDIDDTLIESGEMPSDQWMNWLSERIRILKKNNIAWIPMSGVALIKLGPRILYRLPQDVLSHVLYYGGDGSQKYLFSKADGQWREDAGFTAVFSDAQGIAVLGIGEYKRALNEIYGESDETGTIIETRIASGQRILKENGMSHEKGLLDELKTMLKDRGYAPENSELYFRGGSVSWMIFGDISAEPYREQGAAAVRQDIITFAAKRLAQENNLSHIGDRPISIPFPGARGIKFVLIGNDKERATRNIVETEGVSPGNIIFAGNEIFRGGNDNMIRNIDGVTLLSVGEKTDDGPNVISGGIGVEANRRWMDFICDELQSGKQWPRIIDEMKASKPV